MSNRRTDVVALLGCVGIIVVAFLLLTYGRRNDVASILFFGHFLDALVTTGVVGNVIVFVLLMAAKINPFRAALWTFTIVHVVPLLFITLIIGRNDPGFRLGSVLFGYALSFLFWTGLHWTWISKSRNHTAGA